MSKECFFRRQDALFFKTVKEELFCIIYHLISNNAFVRGKVRPGEFGAAVLGRCFKSPVEVWEDLGDIGWVW